MPSYPPVVLIVDDQQEALAMYAFGLLAIGFLPVISQSAEDAFVRACEIRPDAVVANANLPGVSCFDLTRRLRDDSRTQSTGIIVLMGPPSAVVDLIAGAAVCDRFLTKPCMPDALGLEIRNVLARRQRVVNHIQRMRP